MADILSQKILHCKEVNRKLDYKIKHIVTADSLLKTLIQLFKHTGTLILY